MILAQALLPDNQHALPNTSPSPLPQYSHASPQPQESPLAARVLFGQSNSPSNSPLQFYGPESPEKSSSPIRSHRQTPESREHTQTPTKPKDALDILADQIADVMLGASPAEVDIVAALRSHTLGNDSEAFVTRRELARTPAAPRTTKQ